MYCKDLIALKTIAEGMGLCKTYKQRWDKCESKEDLIRLVSDVNGVRFLCEGITFGWGIDPIYFANSFKKYINGVSYHVGKNNGYKSQIYTFWQNKVVADCILLTFIHCECSVEIPHGRYANIHVCDNSVLSIYCEGSCEIEVYGTANVLFFVDKDGRKIEKGENITIKNTICTTWNKT